jgi:hypothetical protein
MAAIKVGNTIFEVKGNKATTKNSAGVTKSFFFTPTGPVRGKGDIVRGRPADKKRKRDVDLFYPTKSIFEYLRKR